MKLLIDPNEFKVKPGKRINLSRFATRVKKQYQSSEEYEEIFGGYRRKFCDLQDILYAYNRYALLLIFQGMDTSGKDSAIKHVMAGVNPQGCQVFSFKRPSTEELDHDYLWRTNRCLPERGRIGIFNRSYYEEVLVVRVHPELLSAQKIPPQLQKKGKRLWLERYADINNLENYLHRNGTLILKFFLHISKQEQAKRLLARIDDQSKNWKFEPADLKEREFWKLYSRAYEDCLQHTSSKHAPWYIIPSDDKKNGRLIMSQIILDRLSKLKMHYPIVPEEHFRSLRTAKRQLLNSK